MKKKWMNIMEEKLQKQKVNIDDNETLKMTNTLTKLQIQ